MDAIELKQYIIDNNKIIDILEYVGCHKITDRGNEIRCALPNHNNATSVRVKKDTLYIRSFDDTFNMSGDIYSFIMQLNNVSFNESIRKIAHILNIEFDYKKRTTVPKSDKTDVLHIFKKIESKVNSNSCRDEKIEIFNELPEEYIFLPHISWIKESILPFAIEKFNIGFDVRTKRIIIPHRIWCGKSNDFAGIFGRTTLPQYKELDIPKYCSMRKEKYPKTMNIYGLQENYAEIQNHGYVVVFEAEKSVLKRYSKLDKTAVAICGHEISPEQANILISLNVEIVIAMDQGISLEIIKKLCDNFYNIRKVSYIYDDHNILPEKESPADMSDKIYQKMFKNRTIYKK